MYYLLSVIILFWCMISFFRLKKRCKTENIPFNFLEATEFEIAGIFFGFIILIIYLILICKII